MQSQPDRSTSYEKMPGDVGSDRGTKTRVACNSPTADRFGIDKGLVLEFFCTFSRFEYALKRNGFVTRSRDSSVGANWNRFGNGLRKLGSDKCSPVLKACEYLLRHPPKKQVLREERLTWTDTEDTSTADVN